MTHEFPTLVNVSLAPKTPGGKKVIFALLAPPCPTLAVTSKVSGSWLTSGFIWCFVIGSVACISSVLKVETRFSSILPVVLSTNATIALIG